MNESNQDHKRLSPDEQQTLLQTLQARFMKHAARHPRIEWSDVEQKLLAQPHKLWSLSEMERTGGEPDVVETDTSTNEYVFFDCAAESPSGRRSVCFDQAAHQARKANKPRSTAEDMAAEMGVEILTEDQYRTLQELGEFDLKTSSWIQTPAEIRKLGGALFADRRYDHVFIYHNGADSYYAIRGFRAALKV